MSPGHFFALFTVTSAMGGLSVAMLSSGPGSAGRLIVGGIAGVLALFGILVLARVVVLTERERV